MSKEVFEILQQMDLHKIENQLALQCAPLIAGLKVSNLLIVPIHLEETVIRILKGTGISCFKLLRMGEKATFLLFRREQLQQWLSGPQVWELLQEKGYISSDLLCVLELFRRRYQAYMEENREFPHELGLLLGYPVEDVKGFMEHNGREALYCGYWKVYGRVAEKKLLFARFDLAKETVIQLISNGVSIGDVIEIYQDKLPQYAAV